MKKIAKKNRTPYTKNNSLTIIGFRNNYFQMVFLIINTDQFALPHKNSWLISSFPRAHPLLIQILNFRYITSL